MTKQCSIVVISQAEIRIAIQFYLVKCPFKHLDVGWIFQKSSVLFYWLGRGGQPIYYVNYRYFRVVSEVTVEVVENGE